MLGYLFGILITGLIISALLIDCYRAKDLLKIELKNKATSLKLAIEKINASYEYEAETINKEIDRIKSKIDKRD